MSASSRTIDFSKVKDGGRFNRKRIPAGDYLATITKVEDAEAKDEVFQYLFTIKIDKRPSSLLPYYCKLQENQLWKLRNLFIAAGKTVPKSKTKVDPNQIVGKKIGVTIEDEEYDKDGDTIEQSGIAGVFPAAELGDSTDTEEVDENDEAPEDDDDLEDLDTDSSDDEEEEEDPYADMDRTALKAEIKKYNADFQAKKSQTDDDLRALLKEIAEVPSEAADDEEEEDEEPEPPKPAAKKKTTTKKKASEVTDDELEELDIDDL